MFRLSCSHTCVPVSLHPLWQVAVFALPFSISSINPGLMSPCLVGKLRWPLPDFLMELPRAGDWHDLALLVGWQRLCLAGKWALPLPLAVPRLSHKPPWLHLVGKSASPLAFPYFVRKPVWPHLSSWLASLLTLSRKPTSPPALHLTGRCPCLADKLASPLVLPYLDGKLASPLMGSHMASPCWIVDIVPGLASLCQQDIKTLGERPTWPFPVVC